MAPAWSLVAVAVALAAPARGQESIVLTSDYQQADCAAGNLHRQRYHPTGLCTGGNFMWKCSSGVPTMQECPGAASEFSIEVGSCGAEGDWSRQHTCSTPAAYAVMEMFGGDVTCTGEPTDAFAYPLDVCIIYTEDDGSVRSDKFTADGLFRYEGVADCSGTGEPGWTPEVASGACVAEGTTGIRVRIVETTTTTVTAGMAAGAAKAGPALASALLALVAAAAAAA